MLYVVLLLSVFLNTLLLTKVKSQIDQWQKDSLVKSCEWILVSDFTILAQKWFKIAAIFLFFLPVFANHPAVHSGGWSMAGADACHVIFLSSCKKTFGFFCIGATICTH